MRRCGTRLIWPLHKPFTAGVQTRHGRSPDPANFRAFDALVKAAGAARQQRFDIARVKYA